MALGIAVGAFIACFVVLILAMIMMFVVDDDGHMIPAMVVAGVLVVIGCTSWIIGESNDPHKGVVIGKHFEPEHLFCSKGCFYIPDTWSVMLDDNGNQGDRSVSYEVYNSLHVGDYYDPEGE